LKLKDESRRFRIQGDGRETQIAGLSDTFRRLPFVRSSRLERGSGGLFTIDAELSDSHISHLMGLIDYHVASAPGGTLAIRSLVNLESGVDVWRTSAVMQQRTGEESRISEAVSAAMGLSIST